MACKFPFCIILEKANVGVLEEIIIIVILSETPLSRETPLNLSSEIQGFLLEVPRFSLETTIFSSETPYLVTTKKVLGKKVSGKKVLKFHTKKSFGKKSFFKKSPETKSYQFETLFSRTFFSVSSLILCKKVL